ncbi:MAG: hypothetical protein ACREF7_01950 [Candidatus Saccharimonadales bacterium]
MSRMLAQLLDGKEPQFHQTLASLEAASGHPGNDIRLSEALNQLQRAKLRELGLDPDDTTGEELFLALQSKLKADDLILIKRLRSISANKVNAAANLSEGIALALNQATKDSLIFAIKTSVTKRALSKFPPKKVMKALNYRSLDSMVKHVPLGLMVSVAQEIEGSGWMQHYSAFLKTLSPRDFEERAVLVYAPHSDKWLALRSQLLAISKQTILVNKELGSIVILPLPNQPVSGLATLTLASAANGLNAIYATSSYLRLSQVAKDFSARLIKSVSDEPHFEHIDYFSAPLSWETVIRFIHHLQGELGTPLDAHIGAEELIGWQPVEHLIQHIAPEMEFWRDCGYVARLDGNTPVSFNVLDNALSLVNKSVYNDRYSHHVRRSLWQELIARYIRPDLLSQSISAELSPKLATEAAVI